MATICRKRKYKAILQEWEQDFAFIDKDDKPILILLRNATSKFKSQQFDANYQKFMTFKKIKESRRNKLQVSGRISLNYNYFIPTRFKDT